MIATRRQTYFLSDIHLGLDYEGETSAERERLLVDWLMSIEDTAAQVYFLGDIFDYWFEYGEGRQPDYPLFFQQLRTMVGLGIDIRFFTGNHDLWMNDYFPKEYNITIHRSPLIMHLGEKTFFLAHGDGLGKGDIIYKALKRVMTHPLAQWLYGLLPAQLGLSLMRSVSQKSRQGHELESFRSLEEERMVDYCERHPDKDSIDFFILGHRHLPIRYQLQQSSAEYINLGDWIKYKSFASFDGEQLRYDFLQGNHSEDLITN